MRESVPLPVGDSVPVPQKAANTADVVKWDPCEYASQRTNAPLRAQRLQERERVSTSLFSSDGVNLYPSSSAGKVLRGVFGRRRFAIATTMNGNIRPSTTGAARKGAQTENARETRRGAGRADATPRVEPRKTASQPTAIRGTTGNDEGGA